MIEFKQKMEQIQIDLDTKIDYEYFRRLISGDEESELSTLKSQINQLDRDLTSRVDRLEGLTSMADSSINQVILYDLEKKVLEKCEQKNQDIMQRVVAKEEIEKALSSLQA